jgi:hypothetical protein
LGGVSEFQETTLCPAYVRGEAYLALAGGANVATEFKKFIDHPGMLANCPLAVLARLGMAGQCVARRQSESKGSI